jgi:hypothetical protein
MLTLKGGKVYVGFVVSSFVPAREQRTIRIAPLRSGYRDDDKHEVHFTTDYSGALDKIPEDIAKLRKDRLEARKRLQLLKAQEALPEKERAALLPTYTDDIEAAASAATGLLITQRTHMEGVISALTEEIDLLKSSLQDFGMIIRIDEITSSTLYNARVHADYFDHSRPK